MLEQYLKLLDKVDSFTASIERAHARHLICRPGCAECCRQELTVTPVELSYLARFVSNGEQLEKKLVIEKLQQYKNGNNNTDCPLLDGERCMVYQARPLICRTHGLLIDISEPDRPAKITRSCRYNYSSSDPADFPESQALSQHKISTLLFFVNKEFCANAGLAHDVRLPLGNLLEFL